MLSIWAELKRRNVVKVAIAYGVVSWLLIQVAATVFPILGIPDWAVRFVTLLLIIGFPIALIIAWAFELTPAGIKQTSGDELAATLAQAGQAVNPAGYRHDRAGRPVHRNR